MPFLVWIGPARWANDTACERYVRDHASATSASDSAVGIMLRDNTSLTAGANTVLTLDKYAFNPTTHEGALQASLQKGSLAVISGNLPKASPDAVRFQSPSITLGVRGTSFVLEAGGKE